MTNRVFELGIERWSAFRLVEKATHEQKQWQKTVCGDRTAEGGHGKPATVSEGTVQAV